MTPQGRAQGGVPDSDGAAKGCAARLDLGRKRHRQGAGCERARSRLPLCVWAQVAAFMVGEAPDPAPVSACQALSVPVVAADALSDPSVSTRLDGDLS
jgi:hypothetical protein